MVGDFCFILGDMNYRMQGTFDSLVSQIEQLPELRKNLDQLYKSMNELGKYPDYIEYDINFKPTYKREKFEKDKYFNKKNQAPSYTDRVLFKNNTATPVTRNAYRSLEEVLGSDHRPVMLDININLKPLQYLNVPSLLNPMFAHNQGVGIFSFKKLTIQGLKQSVIEQYTKRKFLFPSHLQVSFYGEHLESFPSSSELSLHNTA